MLFHNQGDALRWHTWWLISEPIQCTIPVTSLTYSAVAARQRRRGGRQYRARNAGAL